MAGFDKWAIANTKRLVNTSLPPEIELGAGWDACIASLGRPAAQNGIKALMARGFHKPGNVENRLGYYLGQIARQGKENICRILSIPSQTKCHTMFRTVLQYPWTKPRRPWQRLRTGIGK
jgi:hypothetical protein